MYDQPGGFAAGGLDRGPDGLGDGAQDAGLELKVELRVLVNPGQDCMFYNVENAPCGNVHPPWLSAREPDRTGGVCVISAERRTVLFALFRTTHS